MTYADLQATIAQQQERIEALEEQKHLLQVAFDLNLVTGVKFHEMVEALAAERKHVIEIEEDYARLNAAVVEAHAEAAAERERADAHHTAWRAAVDDLQAERELCMEVQEQVVEATKVIARLNADLNAEIHKRSQWFIEHAEMAGNLAVLEAENKRLKAYAKGAVVHTASSEGHTFGCQCDDLQCRNRREVFGTP